MQDEERNDADRSVPEKTDEGDETGTIESGKDAEAGEIGKYPEWDRLQDDVARQIRANRRFLDRCLDDDFPEEELEENEEEESEDDAPVG